MRYGYDFDGLKSDHNCDFMEDEKFMKSYKKGLAALEATGIEKTWWEHWYWRVYTAMWCAKNAYKLKGDFVEMGVASGFLSVSILDYLDWNKTHGSRKYYLMDTFEGLVKEYMNEEEVKAGRDYTHSIYCNIPFEKVQENFSGFDSVKIVKGRLPDTLSKVRIPDKGISFLHIDMNSAYAETESFKKVYKKLMKGCHVLLDDYGYVTFYAQKKAWDELAAQYGLNILSLPTGQGLIII